MCNSLYNYVHNRIKEKEEMRKEDEEAIIRAVEILKLECDKHKRCKGCKLYVMGCLLDRPPAYYDTESIVKCFT